MPSIKRQSKRKCEDSLETDTDGFSHQSVKSKRRTRSSSHIQGKLETYSYQKDEASFNAIDCETQPPLQDPFSPTALTRSPNKNVSNTLPLHQNQSEVNANQEAAVAGNLCCDNSISMSTLCKDDKNYSNELDQNMLHCIDKESQGVTVTTEDKVESNRDSNPAETEEDANSLSILDPPSIHDGDSICVMNKFESQVIDNTDADNSGKEVGCEDKGLEELDRNDEQVANKNNGISVNLSEIVELSNVRNNSFNSDNRNADGTNENISEISFSNLVSNSKAIVDKDNTCLMGGTENGGSRDFSCSQMFRTKFQAPFKNTQKGVAVKTATKCVEKKYANDFDEASNKSDYDKVLDAEKEKDNVNSFPLFTDDITQPDGSGQNITAKGGSVNGQRHLDVALCKDNSAISNRTCDETFTFNLDRFNCNVSNQNVVGRYARKELNGGGHMMKVDEEEKKKLNSKTESEKEKESQRQKLIKTNDEFFGHTIGNDYIRNRERTAKNTENKIEIIMMNGNKINVQQESNKVKRPESTTLHIEMLETFEKEVVKKDTKYCNQTTAKNTIQTLHSEEGNLNSSSQNCSFNEFSQIDTNTNSNNKTCNILNGSNSCFQLAATNSSSPDNDSIVSDEKSVIYLDACKSLKDQEFEVNGTKDVKASDINSADKENCPIGCTQGFAPSCLRQDKTQYYNYNQTSTSELAIKTLVLSSQESMKHDHSSSEKDSFVDAYKQNFDISPQSKDSPHSQTLTRQSSNTVVQQKDSTDFTNGKAQNFGSNTKEKDSYHCENKKEHQLLDSYDVVFSNSEKYKSNTVKEVKTNDTLHYKLVENDSDCSNHCEYITNQRRQLLGNCSEEKEQHMTRFEKKNNGIISIGNIIDKQYEQDIRYDTTLQLEEGKELCQKWNDDDNDIQRSNEVIRIQHNNTNTHDQISNITTVQEKHCSAHQTFNPTVNCDDIGDETKKQSPPKITDDLNIDYNKLNRMDLNLNNSGKSGNESNDTSTVKSPTGTNITLKENATTKSSLSHFEPVTDDMLQLNHNENIEEESKEKGKESSASKNDNDLLFDIFHTPKDLDLNSSVPQNNNSFEFSWKKDTEVDKRTESTDLVNKIDIDAGISNIDDDNDDKHPRMQTDSDTLRNFNHKMKSPTQKESCMINHNSKKNTDNKWTKNVFTSSPTPNTNVLVSAQDLTGQLDPKKSICSDDDGMDAMMMMMTDSQFCQVSNDNEMEIDFDERQKEAKRHVGGKKEEGKKLVKIVLNELVSVNRQLMRLKREMDLTKRKMVANGTQLNSVLPQRQPGKMQQQHQQQQVSTMFKKISNNPNKKS